jgi:hypothetical protein
LLPLLLVHSKPIRGDFAVNVLITDGSALKPGSQRFRAAIRHVMLHRLVDKPAAFAWLHHPVDGLNRRFRQNDIKTFAHGK